MSGCVFAILTVRVIFRAGGAATCAVSCGGTSAGLAGSMSSDGDVADTGGEPGGRTTVGTAGNGGAAEGIAGGEGGGRKAGESVDVAPGGRARTGGGGISASPPDAGSCRKGLSGLESAGSTFEASMLPSGGGRLGRLIRTVSFVSAFFAGVPVGGGSGVMRTVSFFGSFRLDIEKRYYFWSELPALNCFLLA